jgi:hypothetical protein
MQAQFGCLSPNGNQALAARDYGTTLVDWQLTIVPDDHGL